MKIITIDFAHGTGEDRGAEGYLNEEKVVREYGPLIIAGLQKLGYIVYDCTPLAFPALTLAQSLAYRVNKANYYKSDFHLCIHVNVFETDKAQGCEAEYISDNGKAYADKIVIEMMNQCGFSKHGDGSISRPNLYVQKYTNMPAVLVEPFFCDTKSDCNKYDESIPEGDNIFRIPGTKFYIEQSADGRLCLHNDR
jgi:N-acetylmuramoyl-L-alanine amidase